MSRYLCSLFILIASVLPLISQDDHGHSHAHDEVVGDHIASPDKFVLYAETKKYELTLKYDRIDPKREEEMILYVADYATNMPIDSLDLNGSFQEDPHIKVSFEPHEPGVFHVHANFPEPKSYSLAININSQMNGPDLLLLQPVEIGIDPPKDDHAADEEVHDHGNDIWKFALVFIAGVGLAYLFMRRAKKVATIILIGMLIPASGEYAGAHGGVDHGDEEAGGAGNHVLIAKETQFLFRILTQPLTAGDFQPSVQLFGTIVPAPSGSAAITTPYNGSVISINVRPGQKVVAGQVLATLKPSVSQSEQVAIASETGRIRVETEAARAELTAAEKELNRLRSIEDIAAKKDVQAAEARYNSARANLTALQSAAQGAVAASGSSIILKAPVAGTVGQFTLASGGEVPAGTTLFSITNLKKVFIEAQVYDRDATLVSNAEKYTVTCTNDDHKTAEVSLVSAALEVNPTNQSQRVLFELINPDEEFKIGEFVTIQAFQNKSQKAIFVPNSALSEINGKPVVFVKDHPEEYSVRYISIGEDNGSHTVVQKGLNTGDRYVTDGTYQVKMMMLNQ